MDINAIINEAQSVTSEFGLGLRVVDITDNIVNLRLDIHVDLFIQIYANCLKDKLNLTLVFRGKRLFGADAEGGRYHIHLSDKPESHIFTDEKENIRGFVIKSLKVLDERELL